MSNKRVGKFLLVGVSLHMLSMGLLFYFNDIAFIAQKTSFLITTIVTYTLQFIINSLWTWRDRKATIGQNAIRIVKFVPIKIVIWALNQKVYEIWDFLTATYVYPLVSFVPDPNAALFWERLGLTYQIPNALSVLTIMLVNYVIFDRLIFVNAHHDVSN